MTDDDGDEIARCYAAWAATLESLHPPAWDVASLCAGWRVREVVAHATMPARSTPEQFGEALAAAGGDFTALSDAIAARDADLPVAEHLAHLRSPVLAAWRPGGDATGALNHAVVHSLDVTLALGVGPVFPPATARRVLDDLTRRGIAARFGVDLPGHRVEATDLDWGFGSGHPVTATAAELIALLCHRTLPDGRAWG